MSAFDPFALDRTLAGHARQHRRWVEALRQGRGAEHAFELLPTGISSDRARELLALGATDSFAAAAARWMEFLLGEHASLEARLAVAQAETERRHAIDVPERGTLSIAGLVERLLGDAARRSGWLDALVLCASDVGARRLSLFEQQNERALRTATLEGTDTVLEAGGDLLDLSNDAYAELRVNGLPRFIELGIGSDVPGDFPATLSARRLADFFREGRLLHGLEPKLPALPRALGASSTLRALALFGRALHEAGAQSGPFVISHDPYEFRARCYGYLFGLLPLHPSFAGRRLGIGQNRLANYQHALGRVLLLGARLHVARALLAKSAAVSATAYRACFAEQIPFVLGFELSPRLAGVLLVDEDGVRSLAALLSAVEHDRVLTDRHDEDWFRNPRCHEELRGELESPPLSEPVAEVLRRGARTFAAMLNV
jgi:hypothetical protein